MTATAIPVGPTWNSELLRNEYVNSVGNVAVRPDGKRAYVTFGATIAERGVGGQSNGSFFTDAQGVSWMVTGGYSGVSVIDTDPTSSNFNKEIARIIVPLGYTMWPPAETAFMSRVAMARLSPSSIQ